MVDFPALPQQRFDSLPANIAFAQPQLSGASAHPTVAGMPSPAGWEALLPRAQTPGDMISAAELGAKLRAQGQRDQGRNALAQLYSNPANVDANGTLKPQALAQLYAMGFGDQALAVQGTQSEIASRQATAQTNTQKLFKEQQQGLISDFAPLEPEWNENNKKYGPDRANQIGQEHYTELVDKAKQSGMYSPQLLAQINPRFDINRLRTNIYGPEGIKKEERAESKEKRESVSGDRERYGNSVTLTLKDGTTTTARLDKDSPTGSYISGSTEINPSEIKSINTLASHPANELSASKEVAVVDKDGNVVNRVAARERKDRPGWVRSDNGADIEIPPGGHIDVGQAAGAVIAGSRESVYNNRVLNAAVTATTSLKAVTAMPSTVSSGFMGFGSSPVGLLDAPRSLLANSLTSQDAQLFNASMLGVGRALAQVETAGLSPGARFSEQLSGLTLKPTDTLATKLYKLADMRQIVENGVTVLMANPRVAPEQKKLAEQMATNVRNAVPWTIQDVVAVQYSDDPRATLKSMGVKFGGAAEKAEQGGTKGTPPSKEATPAAPQGGAEASPSQGPPESAFKGKRYVTNPQTGETWERRDDGSIVRVPR